MASTQRVANGVKEVELAGARKIATSEAVLPVGKRAGSTANVSVTGREKVRPSGPKTTCGPTKVGPPAAGDELAEVMVMVWGLATAPAGTLTLVPSAADTDPPRGPMSAEPEPRLPAAPGEPSPFAWGPPEPGVSGPPDCAPQLETTTETASSDSRGSHASARAPVSSGQT